MDNVAPDGVATTHRSIVVDGRKLHYTARAGFIPLRLHETGQVTGEMFFTSYTVEPRPGEPPRPITFHWDGGPGGAASLSDGAPRIVKRDGDKVEDNPETLLGVSDLVYIDEMGTGYSRMTSLEFKGLFFNPAGDAESFAEFMRIYLKRYDPSSRAPIFVAGGSYGTIRAPLVAQAAARRRMIVRGMILSSSALTMTWPITDLYYALILPTYTASAQAHSKLPADLQGLSLEALLKDAERWAIDGYLPALARGNSLSDADRQAIVGQLARYTGLAPEVIDGNNLRVKASVFSRELLRAEGFEVNGYDTREKVPLVAGSTTAASDPTKWPSGSAITSLRERLLLQELGVHSDLLYAGPFGGEWPPPAMPQGDWMSVKWFGPSMTFDDSPAPGTELALPALIDTLEAGDGALHVAISGGYYDAVTPYFTCDYVAHRVRPEFRDNIEVYHRSTGHSGNFTREQLIAFYRKVLASKFEEHRGVSPAG